MSRTFMHVSIVALLLSGAVIGQEKGAPREDVRAKATIKAVKPGLLGVVTAKGEQWWVKVDAQPQNVSFVASADKNWLRPGMLVRFKNTFDVKGKPLAAVDRIEVISRRADTKLGLIPDSKFGGSGLFSDDEEPQKKKAPQAASFTVAGTLRGIKGGTMLVAAGRTVVHSRLAEDAKVSVDVSDYSLARDGDSVDLSGWHYAGQKNRVFARSLKISSTRKLSGAADEKAKSKNKQKDGKEEKTDVENAWKTCSPASHSTSLIGLAARPVLRVVSSSGVRRSSNNTDKIDVVGRDYAFPYWPGTPNRRRPAHAQSHRLLGRLTGERDDRLWSRLPLCNGPTVFAATERLFSDCRSCHVPGCAFHA